MRKLVGLCVVALGAWLALSVSWALAARATGFPGPTRLTAGTIHRTADALERAPVPPPLRGVRAFAAERVREGARLAARAYRLPERMAAGLMGRTPEDLERYRNIADGGRAPAVRAPSAPAPPRPPRPADAAGISEAHLRAHIRSVLRSQVRAHVRGLAERAGEIRVVVRLPDEIAVVVPEVRVAP